MKKFLLSAALIAAATFSLSAQEKGDMAVGGTLGVSGGVESETSNAQFELSPQFSYFVIDNLELSAGLKYTLDAVEKNTLNVAMFTVGANYYLPLVKGKLFYTPGVQFGFGGGSQIVDFGGEKLTGKLPFAFGFSADLGKFEFKALDCLGVTLNALDFTVLYLTTEAKTAVTNFTAGFNYGMSVGVKYYF